MGKMGYFWINFVTTFAAIVYGLPGKAEVSTRRCDILFADLIRVRDAIVKDPSIDTDVRPEHIQGIAVEHIPLLLGIDIHHDEGWRALACSVAAAEDMDALTAALGVEWGFEARELIHKDLMQGFYERWRYSLNSYQSTLLNLASWVAASGFPDTWPLQTNAHATADVIRHAQQYGVMHYIAFGTAPSSPFPDWRTVSNALTAATSMDNYLRRIGSSDMLDYPELLRQNVEESKQITSREGAEAKTETMRAGLNLVETLIDLGVIDIVEDYAYNNLV